MTNVKVISEDIKLVKIGLVQGDLSQKPEIKYTTLMKVKSVSFSRRSVKTTEKKHQKH